jgi:glycosyltransferase involved in cell wall biosynthesis
MPDEQARLIVVDATPLASGHAVRGIGRYLDGVIGALVREEPSFVDARVRFLVCAGQDPPADRLQLISTARATVRPQDLGWAVAAIADRRAATGLGPAWWHQTDPMLPWSPMPPDRTLATAYDLIPLREAAVWRAIRPHRRLIYRAYLRGLRNARGIVTISRETAADLHRTLGIPADRIRVVPPAIIAQVSDSAVSLDSHASPSLLFVGVMDPHKRPELALETLAALRRRMPGATLAFVGPSPEARVNDLRGIAAALGVAEAVAFRGRVPDDELTALYRQGVLLAVSRIEGFGLPPVEAILAGGRTVAVPTAIYREVLGGAATYAVSDQPSAIADAVEGALTDPVRDAERAVLGARFAPSASAALLRVAYEELTA